MSNSAQIFDPLLPLWLIAILMIPLFSFFIWREIKKPQKFIALRILAQFIVLISIIGILLKPSYLQEIKSHGIILLTADYSKREADSLLRLRPDMRLIRLQEAASYSGAEVLTTYNDLTRLRNGIQFILGNGLPDYALELMGRKNFYFLPATTPIGITQLHIPENIKSNQQNSLSGTVNIDGETTLTLHSPGGVEDSVIFKGKGSIPFLLHFKPKQAGLTVCNLSYKNGSRVLTEKLPLVVTEEQKLSILFLQNFPSFEVRQLKNFMAENGHRMTLRYQVSKSKYRFEFVNMPSNRIIPITSSGLQLFDLVIIDNEALDALSSIEKIILEESIHNGLGMIIILHKSIEKDKVRERFLSIEMKKTLKDTVQLNFKTRRYILPVLPFQISESPSVYPVTRNRNSILSAYTYNGLGKVGFQLLQETYRISLEGNIDEYAALWSPLLERIARSENEKFKLQLKNDFPHYQNEPLNVEIISSVEAHPTVHHDQVNIPLIEHVSIDNIWIGKTWAGKPGWHQLSCNPSTLSYFVSDPQAWETLRIANQMKKNETTSVTPTEFSSSKLSYHQKIISPLIFYILFLLASGFLWLVPKI